MKTDNASIPAGSPGDSYAAGRAERARKARRAIVAAVAVVVLLVAVFRIAHALHRPSPPATPPPNRDFSRFASPELPLDRGLALVVVLAMDCGHCRETAKIVGTFDAEALAVGIYFILSGKPEEVDPFFEAIGASVPYHLATMAEYLDLVADEPTAVCLLSNGQMRAEWPPRQFSLRALRDELARGQ